ncbi:MAG TPA: hypothetical protein PKB13_08150 [Clostridia bacterium]|nr:hypothetical protein [Clostridia bacterium]
MSQLLLWSIEKYLLDKEYNHIKEIRIMAMGRTHTECLLVAEAQRVVAEMKALKEPNSPNKTHFMVEISQDFLINVGNTSRLFQRLPYKTLYFSTLNDQKGIFAFVRKDEPRDKEVRMPRQDLLIR